MGCPVHCRAASLVSTHSMPEARDLPQGWEHLSGGGYTSPEPPFTWKALRFLQVLMPWESAVLSSSNHNLDAVLSTPQTLQSCTSDVLQLKGCSQKREKWHRCVSLGRGGLTVAHRPIPTCRCILQALWPIDSFYIFKWLKRKSKQCCFASHETDMTFKFRCPSVKFCWHSATSVHLRKVGSCSHTTRAELSGCSTGHWPTKPQLSTL